MRQPAGSKSTYISPSRKKRHDAGRKECRGRSAIFSYPQFSFLPYLGALILGLPRDSVLVSRAEVRYLHGGHLLFRERQLWFPETASASIAAAAEAEAQDTAGGTGRFCRLCRNTRHVPCRVFSSCMSQIAAAEGTTDAEIVSLSRIKHELCMCMCLYAYVCMCVYVCVAYVYVYACHIGHM